MKKILLILSLLLFTTITNAQNLTNINYDKNYLTTWYGNGNSFMIEYGRNVNYDYNTSQKYGFDISGGYNFTRDLFKISLGSHGIVETRSGWNPIYKMGLTLYELESYDVFIGGGVEKNKIHLVTKLNFITIAVNKFKYGEWIEIGVGYSF